MHVRMCPQYYNAAMLLRTLGGLALIPSSFTRPKPLLLLCFLALEGPKERRYLADLFWQGATNPLNRLAVTLARLRAAEPGSLSTNTVRVWTDLSTDVHTLLTALEQGEFEKVVDLYHGPFLEGVDFDSWGSELADWAYSTRDFIANHVKMAHLALAETQARRGKFHNAANRAEAAYSVAQTAGLDPSDIARLHTLLLAGNHPRTLVLEKEAMGFGVKLLATSAEAKDALKRLSMAERDIPNNLPRRSSSFVGRDLELAELNTLLYGANNRLITLVGTAGVGKTHLALQVAHDLLKQEQFRDGVFFASLEAVDSPSLIPFNLTTTLGLELSSQDEPLAQLIRHLRDTHLLLILDNYEHLLEGAELVADLLRECPDLKLLVTSRERLNLKEELGFTVEGLAYPLDGESSPVDQERYDAVQLFLQRARRMRPDFGSGFVDLPSILKICRLVEGLPLGLELAAVWVRLMPPIEIAREIERSLDLLTTSTRNVPGRHRSLRAAFEHSWKLLESREQDVLRKLSVFRGGFRREAASAVSGATIPLLAALTDKSLMRVDLAGRYDFHPLLHQFIGQKLAENPEEQEAASSSHAAYFVSMVEEAEPQLYGSAQRTWLERLEEELSNLRAALHWAEQSGQALSGLQVAKVLGEFCQIRGYCSEGRELLSRALNQPSADERTKLRASVLSLAGRLAWMQSENALARSLFEESLAISQALGDKRGLATTLCRLGNVCIVLGDLCSARSLSEESLALYRALQDRYGILDALSNIGYITLSEGNYPLARSRFEECLAMSRELRNDHMIYTQLYALGETIAHQGDLDLARTLIEQSLKMGREQGARWNLMNMLNQLGQIATKQGDLRSARTFLEESMTISQQVWDRWAIIYAIESFASLATAMGDFGRTVRLWSAADALREVLGYPLLPYDQPRYHQDLADARTQLGESVFQEEWSAGRLLSQEQAVAHALSLGRS